MSRRAAVESEFEWAPTDGPGHWLLLMALIAGGIVLVIVVIAIYLH